MISRINTKMRRSTEGDNVKCNMLKIAYCVLCKMINSVDSSDITSEIVEVINNTKGFCEKIIHCYYFSLRVKKTTLQ